MINEHFVIISGLSLCLAFNAKLGMNFAQDKNKFPWMYLGLEIVLLVTFLFVAL